MATKATKATKKRPKKRPKKSKTQHIREYLIIYPEATSAEVIEAMKKKRLRVSNQLVYNARAKLGLNAVAGTKRSATRGGNHKSAAGKATPAAKSQAGFSSNELFAAKELVDAVGGFSQAKRALDILAKLR